MSPKSYGNTDSRDKMPSFKDADLQRRILKTLTYSDIFDYPLTAHEVTDYLISNTEVGVDAIRKILKISTDNERIYTDGEFYFLREREGIVKTRKERKVWAKEKLEIAQKTVGKLKTIPSIKMIGVTGALAMDNCKEEDDVDLLIVTSANSLWLTRFLIILFCPVLGIKRRKRGEKETKDKICFNLFLEENHLKIEFENLFLAHEICQVKPIYDKDGIYEKFVRENRWVSSFLPNVFDSAKCKVQSAKSQFKVQSLFSPVFKILNKVAYKLQFWYMKPKMTVEKVSLHKAFFHPNDLSDKIQKEFERRIKSLDNKAEIHL